MKRKIVAVVLAAVFALLPQLSFSAAESLSVIPLVEWRTYGTNTYSACVTLGQGGQAHTADIPVVAGNRVSTSGSNTTVAAVTASTMAPFTFVAVGDSLRFSSARSVLDPFRTVTARASADSITVNRAIDLDPTTAPDPSPTGYLFHYRNLSCSTAAGTSYFPVSNWQSGNFLLLAEAESSATSGIDYQVQCYVDGAARTAITIVTGNIAQVDIPTAVPLADYDMGTFGYTHCRLSVKVAAGTVTYSAYAVRKR